MADKMCSTQIMPRFVIDTCPSEDNQDALKSQKILKSKACRTSSLPNLNETYKDLCGAVHRTCVNNSAYLLKRSRSYPNYSFIKYLKLYEKTFQIPSPSRSLNFHMNSLDPNGGGTQTPGGSSSRYSLYGSFFDLSESGYYPASDNPVFKLDNYNRRLTVDGRPLLFIERSPGLSTNAYEDKCTDWLQHINTNSI